MVGGHRAATMEISPVPAAIHSIPRSTSSPHFYQFPFPLSTRFSLSSKPSCPLHYPLPSLRQKWRQHLTSKPHALSEEATAAVNMETKSDTIDSSLAVKKKATDVFADLRGTSIFLVGMNSAMKTSVGKLIADVLRYYYFDSDSIVEEAAGKDSSGKSFKERDEDGFRVSETEVLKQLSSMGRLVINAGNGAVQSTTNLALLRHGISIWIDVPLDMIAQEGGEGDQSVSNMSAPDSFSEGVRRLSLLYNENRAGYSTADATVSLQNVASRFGFDGFEQVTAEDMALEVLREIEKLTRVKKLMEEAGRPF